jgi:ABC-type multidrug transport system ATPase subunit
MSLAVLRAEGVTKRFGTRTVLASASLTARRGSITVLLGRNGSGKTTLLRVAAGVIGTDQGVVHFHGRIHTRPSIHRLAREGLFFMPERDLLLRNLPVRDQLDLVATRFGSRSRVRAVEEEMALVEYAERYPHEVSAGERRRAELALVVLRAPTCLLADEPFMGISPRDAESVAARLRALADNGCAVVITGHEVPMLMDLADDIVWVTAGTTHGLGTATQARANWQFRREYLGAPAGSV